MTPEITEAAQAAIRVAAGERSAPFALPTVLRAAAALRARTPPDHTPPDHTAPARVLVDELLTGLAATTVRCYTCRPRSVPDDGVRPELVLTAAAGATADPDPVDPAALNRLLAHRPDNTAPDVLTLDARATPLLDQDFATRIGATSIVVLAAPEFAVLVLTREPPAPTGLDHLHPLAAAIRAHLRTDDNTGDEDYLTAVETCAHHLADTVERLRAEAGLVDTLHAVGQRLTAELDIDTLVQDATDAATRATGAAFGAFFYNMINQYGESYTLYTLSGVPRAAFERFPMPRNTAVFAPTFDGMGTVRSDDIVQDDRFGHNDPHHGMPEGHLPVHSYLAVSAVSPTTGEVLGGFFFGHPLPGQFTERHQFLAEGIAGYAAIALDNARLFDRERNMATELSRAMLPSVPDIPGIALCTRYLPAATGSKVGGDWFDVIQLDAGRTAFVIGDVVGHGVTAAATMGQVRTAIRSYALLDLSPGELLHNVSHLVEAMPEPGFVTCFYAVHDPTDHTLTYANAGHLPALLIHPDDTVDQIGEGLAQPLGIGTTYPQQQTAFPPGTDLVLYTDGLVESHSRDLTIGIDALVAAVPELRRHPDDPGAACDELIEQLTHGRHDDDIAFLHASHDTSPHENGGRSS